ncbi:MAG: hypothetical protein ABI471_00610 [Sphingomonas bacterium]
MVQTTATDPGTIAVPMSSILDALEGVLTEAERTALFEQLIGLRPTGVAPGDLITAELFNQMQSDINDLARRVTLIESSSNTTPKAPIIHQIVPQLVHSGDELLVLGENLTPSLLSRIEVEDSGVPISSLKAGSGATQLIFNAPAVIGLPSGGATVILSIDNPAGSAQASYTQLPGIAAQIQANVAFVLKSVTPSENLVANKDYTFVVELQIHSSHDETFQLVPHVDAGWTAAVSASDKIPVTADSAVNGFTIQKTVTVHTAANGSANLVFELKGTSFPAFTQSAQPIPLAIGAKPVIPSEQIKFINVAVPGPHGFSNNVVNVFKTAPGLANGATVTLNVSTLFATATSYTIDSLSVSPAADWQINSSPATPFTTAQADFTRVLSFVIQPLKKSADGKTFTSGNGTISFTVSAQGGAQQKFTAALQVTA